MLDRTAQAKYKRAKSPFMGLLASRVSCIDCGYTAAIRHSTFDSLSLTVPLQYSCNLEQCLDSFIHLDTISDFNCRKCTLLGASADLSRKIEQGKKIQRQRENKEQEGQELQALEQSEYQMNSRILMTLTEETQHKLSDTKSPTTPDDPSLTQDAPAPAKRRRSSRLQSSLSEPFADNKTTSPKPGKISLAEMEQLKARVDLCLSSDIEMDLRTTKHSMIAKPPQALCLHLNRSMFTSSGQMAKNPWSHNSGHFVTYRRIPNSSDEQLTRDVSNDDKWWRISDEDVQIVEWALVKNVEAYMLFYEKLL
ncbi:hypothetical protein EC991_008940 [Linnemannia zychae]|nr:hypothetical protein EC991_008940 [Linnemannia zychae]